MPRKIRELLHELERARFVDRGGKGSHRNLKHPKGIRITLGSQLGEDAKPYQERTVQKALKEVKHETG